MVQAQLDSMLRNRPCLLEHVRPNGSVIELHCNPLPAGGQVISYVDVTERKQAEEELRLIAKAFESTADGIVIVDKDQRIVSINNAFTSITGYTREEAVGKNRHFMELERYGRDDYERLCGALNTKGYWQGELWNRRKNGELYPQWLTINAVRDQAGTMTHYVGVLTDISQRKQDEARLNFLAHHDPLTHLPNRTLFQERSNDAIVRAHRHGGLTGLLFIDLDRFKTINDSLGHAMGDLLLQAVAERLGVCVRESDLVARLGGDEFTVLIDELTEFQDAAIVARKLLDELAKPFSLLEHTLYISASIGITCYPQDGKDVQTLLRNADAAMYRAKEEGRNGYRFFSSEMNTEALATLTMTNSLGLALERQEFILHYQPRFDLISRRITGVEALIRWQHPDLGLVPAAQFIPLAEETGMIGSIWEWVLKTACTQAKAWQIAGLPPLRMAVNLSARQFRQHDLAQSIAVVLNEIGLDASALELEITETMVVQAPERTRLILAELKAMGIAISIDDFGTGYSSLSYLKRYPIDYLKIDRSFINGLPLDADDGAITRAIIAMAKSLKLRVVAEGVETLEQSTFLEAAGCEDGQGYLFSRPQAAPDLKQLLVRNLV